MELARTDTARSNRDPKAIARGQEVVTWNVTPWYIGSNTRIRPTTAEDLRQSRACVREFLCLLGSLRVAVTMGRPATKGWDRLGMDIPSIPCPHPSPLNLNSRPEARAEILAALQRARGIAEGDL